MGDYDNMTMLYKAALFGLAWSMILTAVGFGALSFEPQERGARLAEPQDLPALEVGGIVNAAFFHQKLYQRIDSTT